MGTNDLSKELDLNDVMRRTGLETSILTCLIATKANKISLIDGVYNNIKDAEGFEESGVMKSTNGTIHKCEGSKETATSLGYNRNNGQIFLGGTIIIQQGGNDKDASCHAIVKWDKKKADCFAKNLTE